MVTDGEHLQPPLDGLRIIDLSTYVAGPSGAMALAQLGADVIRIDPIGGATDTTRLPLAPNGSSLYWAGLNKGKRSVEIDTTTPQGRELVYDLVGQPGPGKGIVLTNAVGQDWLAYEALSSRRPDVILVHIVGHADGGPAVDYTVNCEVGLPLMTGPIDVSSPVNHVLPAWDLLAGLQAAIAILVAEKTRVRTGGGGHVTVSLADVAAANMAHLGFVADVVVNGRGRQRDGNFLYGSFGCDFVTADDRRVMIVALTRRHWRKLVALTGIGEAIEAIEASLGVDLADESVRFEHREVIVALLRPWFAQRSFDEVTAALDEGGVLWGPYRTVEEFVHDPASLLHQGDLMVDVDHPTTGRYPTPRSVPDFKAWRERSALPAHPLGSDTRSLLAGDLGLSDEQIDRLQADGTIGGTRR